MIKWANYLHQYINAVWRWPTISLYRRYTVRSSTHPPPTSLPLLFPPHPLFILAFGLCARLKRRREGGGKAVPAFPLSLIHPNKKNCVGEFRFPGWNVCTMGKWPIVAFFVCVVKPKVGIKEPQMWVLLGEKERQFIPEGKMLQHLNRKTHHSFLSEKIPFLFPHMKIKIRDVIPLPVCTTVLCIMHRRRREGKQGCQICKVKTRLRMFQHEPDMLRKEPDTQFVLLYVRTILVTIFCPMILKTKPWFFFSSLF